MKTLVAYFSHAGENYVAGAIRNLKKGNAAIIAEKAKQLLGADLFEIETVKTYPNGYQACCDEAAREQQEHELPQLKRYLPSIDKYEKIVLVYPCWWGTMPQAVMTFLHHYDFSNKIIVPICTHEGSGMGRSEIDIKTVIHGAKIQGGLAIQGSQAESCDERLKQYL